MERKGSIILIASSIVPPHRKTPSQGDGDFGLLAIELIRAPFGGRRASELACNYFCSDDMTYLVLLCRNSVERP
jgi:hypothetical protein